MCRWCLFSQSQNHIKAHNMFMYCKNIFRNCSSNYLQTFRSVIYTVKCHTAGYQSLENPITVLPIGESEMFWSILCDTYSRSIIGKLKRNIRRKLWPNVAVYFSSRKRGSNLGLWLARRNNTFYAMSTLRHSLCALTVVSFVPPATLSTSTWL